MTEHFPPSGNNPENGGLSDPAVRSLAFEIEAAQKPLHLREIHAVEYSDERFLDISQGAMALLGEVTLNRLQSFGIDTRRPRDPRVMTLVDAVVNNYAGTRFNPQGDQPSHQPHAEYFHAYHRILSAMDPRSDRRMRLIAQEDLASVDLSLAVGRLAAKTVQTTEYVVPGSEPETATRRITDPNSRYWDCEIAVTAVGGRPLSIESVFEGDVKIIVPTGTIADQSVRDLNEVAHAIGPAAAWPAGMPHGYLPRRISAQTIVRGAPSSMAGMYDTPSKLVSGFIEYALRND